MACMSPALPCCDTADENGSRTLERVAKQLQLHKIPISVDGDQDRNDYATSTRDVLERQCSGRRERTAAVLICLFESSEGELKVFLTKRSMKLSSFPGDVALPGGKMDETDIDYSATAVREALEEIGLDPNMVRVVANLDPFICIHNYIIKVIPVIGLLDRVEDFKPALNSDEVDSLFDVPLEMFIQVEHHSFEEKEWMDTKYVTHNFEFKSESQGTFLIRGLTASILVKTASLIYQRSPSFQPNHLPDFQQLQHI